jgi:hypothetical protein
MILGAGVLAAALFLLLLLISNKPDASGLFLLAILAVLGAGAMWWQAIAMIRALNHRTRLTVARILSDGRPREPREIDREVLRQMASLRYPPLRWFHFPSRALSEMTHRGVLERIAGRYSAAKRS